MAKRAFKLHKTGSAPKFSIIQMFVFAWLFVMTGGLIYMFHSQIMESYKNFESNGSVQKVLSVKLPPSKVVDKVSIIHDNHVSDIPSSAKQVVDKVVIPDHQIKDIPGSKVQSPPSPKIEAEKSNIRYVPEVQSEPIKLSSGALKTKNAVTPPGKVRKKITELLKLDNCDHPPPILKGKDMWQMKVHEQRQYLQDIHCNETNPSTAPAERFMAQVKKALETPVDERTPSIWDVPLYMQEQIRTSKPGDIVKYHIAGKDVSLPYGYPEESIFVLTASYRDPEVAYTIARAYARAAHPERIFFGIHAQNAAGEEEPERDPIGGLPFTGVKCPEHPVCKRLHQIHVSRAHWSRSEGPTIARAIAEQFYTNETYTMGIDSHCHFLRGWDNVGIDMFKRIGNDHAIITTYPPGYTSRVPRGDGSEDYDVDSTPKTQTSICRTRRMNFHTTVSFKHDFSSIARPLHGPIRTAFFAAGFSFSRGHRILRIPYDMHTPFIFDGEEISMGVRAWTWGYDLYQPDRDIITHLYIAAHSGVRPVFWESEFWGIQWPCQFGSLLRLQKQLRIFSKLQKNEANLKGKLDMEEFDLYDTGPRRPAEMFWDWAHIDLQNNWGEHCTKAGHPEIQGREHCYSESLCHLYEREGGMDYVPWKEGTEGRIWHCQC